MANRLTDLIVIILMLINMVVSAIYLFPSLFIIGINVLDIEPFFMLKIMTLMSLAMMGHAIIAHNLFKFSTGFTGSGNK